MDIHEKLYVAIDTDDVDFARRLVGELKGKVGGFKIGLTFIYSLLGQLLFGPNATDLLLQARRLFAEIGDGLFLDGKVFDIPKTIEGACHGLELFRPKFFTIPAAADPKSIQIAADNKASSLVLGVTLLTTVGNRDSLGLFEYYPAQLVTRFAKVLARHGADGFVCSVRDLEFINKDQRLATHPKMVVGIRPSWWQDKAHDQIRTATPTEAQLAGATWMVIGRPITRYHKGPTEAVKRILDEMAQAV